MAFREERKLWVGLRSFIWPNLHRETRFAAIATHAVFGDYRDFAVQISGSASYALVWTLDGSPLKIQSAKADEEFKKYRCHLAKIRLVIFRSTKEIDDYIRAKDIAEGRTNNSSWKKRIVWRRQRKNQENALKCRAFEDACKGGEAGGRVYFTTLDLLRTHTKLESDDLDIGVIWPNQSSLKFCFQTDFLTKQFSDEGKVFGKVKIFPLKRDCEGVDDIECYERIILDLLVPNRSESRDKWAFEHPKQLRKQTHRIRWFLNRIKRRARQWLDKIVGFEVLSLTRRSRIIGSVVFLILVTLYVLVFGLRVGFIIGLLNKLGLGQFVG